MLPNLALVVLCIFWFIVYFVIDAFLFLLCQM